MDDRGGAPLAEAEAMRRVAEALKSLDAASVSRVLRWAAEHFAPAGMPAPLDPVGWTTTIDLGRFRDFSEFLAAAKPSVERDKAIVGAYWVQLVDGHGEFTAQMVNTVLKGAGKGVANITSALNGLIHQAPPLALQLKKAGTTKQARKQYRLTAAGRRAVEELVGVS